MLDPDDSPLSEPPVELDSPALLPEPPVELDSSPLLLADSPESLVLSLDSPAVVPESLVLTESPEPLEPELDDVPPPSLPEPSLLLVSSGPELALAVVLESAVVADASAEPADVSAGPEVVCAAPVAEVPEELSVKPGQTPGTSSAQAVGSTSKSAAANPSVRVTR